MRRSRFYMAALLIAALLVTLGVRHAMFFSEKYSSACLRVIPVLRAAEKDVRALAYQILASAALGLQEPISMTRWRGFRGYPIAR